MHRIRRIANELAVSLRDLAHVLYADMDALAAEVQEADRQLGPPDAPREEDYTFYRDSGLWGL